jgi:3-deoxy-D-manno-octulosonic-acid transferase
MSVTHSLYDAALRSARSVLELAARFDGKLSRAMVGRHAALARFEGWASTERNAALPLVWVHAPSVGEALMASAIIRALRAARPDCQIAFTFFSPSAERMAAGVGADVFAYLPWDTEAEVTRALAALCPRVVAFVRTEVWPTLVREARRGAARVALVNAPLAEHSTRLRPLARRLLSGAYAQLDAVGAVTDADARRLTRLGVRADRVCVTGDARFDQVRARIASLDRSQPFLVALARSGAPVIVAGSTWPADEDRLIDAWKAVQTRTPALLVIAPHEPTRAHTTRLERALDASGLAHARLDAVLRPEVLPGVLIVDRVGVLADLYAAARVAYVGGGFGHAGLHSVIEPAALGVPVVFGPHAGNAVEAGELAAAGGGFGVRDAAELARTLVRLLDDATAGAAATAYVRSRLGGASRNAALLERLLD